MCKMSLERMGGLALIVGPVLAFVMFLLQPGGILIDTAAPSDPIATINALADNQTPCERPRSRWCALASSSWPLGCTRCRPTFAVWGPETP